jgi:hypothetical protein
MSVRTAAMTARITPLCDVWSGFGAANASTQSRPTGSRRTKYGATASTFHSEGEKPLSLGRKSSKIDPMGPLWVRTHKTASDPRKCGSRNHRYFVRLNGAARGIRTPDPIITNFIAGNSLIFLAFP